MVFRLESDLRGIWKEAMIRRSYWVEPAIGSTCGLPDVFHVNGGESVFAELKRGSFNGEFLCYKVRKSQRMEIPNLISDGATVVVAVAIRLTNYVHIIDVSLCEKAVLSGNLSVRMLWTMCQRESAMDDGTKTPHMGSFGVLGGKDIVWVAWGRRSLEFMQKAGFCGMKTMVELPPQMVGKVLKVNDWSESMKSPWEDPRQSRVGDVVRGVYPWDTDDVDE